MLLVPVVVPVPDDGETTVVGEAAWGMEWTTGASPRRAVTAQRSDDTMTNVYKRD